MSEPTLYNHVFSHYSFKSMFSISVYTLPIRTKRFVFKVTETSVEFSDQKQLLAYANARETPMHIQDQNYFKKYFYVLPPTDRHAMTIKCFGA